MSNPANLVNPTNPAIRGRRATGASGMRSRLPHYRPAVRCPERGDRHAGAARRRAVAIGDSGGMAEGGEARTGRRGTRRAGIAMVVLGVGIVVVDQLVKTWALGALADGPIDLLGDSVRLLLVFNSGAAFSLGENATPIFSVLASIVVLGLLWFSRRLRDPWWAVGLGLILGGAAGNLVDRLVRAPSVFHGHVVDYFSVGWFPVFNLADASLTVGVVVIALAVLLGRDPYPALPEERADA